MPSFCPPDSSEPRGPQVGVPLYELRVICACKCCTLWVPRVQCGTRTACTAVSGGMKYQTGEQKLRRTLSFEPQGLGYIYTAARTYDMKNFVIAAAPFFLFLFSPVVVVNFAIRQRMCVCAA